MSDLDKLEKAWRDAEAKAIKLQNDKDEAVQKARDRFAERQRTAVDDAAAKQKLFLDAHAAEELRDRRDGAAVAEKLGLTLED